jgi:tRNA(fMet)-specific endonuclease VapC
VRKSLIDTDILSEIRKLKNTKINAQAIAYRGIAKVKSQKSKVKCLW